MIQIDQNKHPIYKIEQVNPAITQMPETFGEFIKWAKSNGIKDDMPIMKLDYKQHSDRVGFDMDILL